MTWQDLKGIRYEMAPFQGITENLPGWDLQTPGTTLLVHDISTEIRAIFVWAFR